MPQNIHDSLNQIYTKREWRIAGVLFISYVAVHGLVTYFIPATALLDPAAVLALTCLYFGGLRLWPVVYISALAAYAITGAHPLQLFALPIIEVLQATAGAFLLQSTHIDPLFRRYRDTFYFIITVVGVTFISATLKTFLRIWEGMPLILSTWWHIYIAALSCFLIFMPFILRWFTKPRFSRTPMEIVETGGIFAVLVYVNHLLFVQQVQMVLGIPLAYFLFIPLFWIALRLRPRFITLALVLTFLFAIASVLAYTDTSALSERLFETELFLITLGALFFIVTSLEEDRRVNTNLMRSQLVMLKNAVAKESSESKAKNDFIAILSHELRNPLAPILSSIDLLKLKGARDQDDANLFDMMEDRMQTVRRLLDDLLDISRISEGKVTLKKERVDLVPILKAAVITTNHHRKELHQRLVLKLPEKPVHVLGDAVRLEQTISNLLTNASKYSGSGDTVTLSLREKNGIAEIDVVDKGVGLSPHDLEIIFMPFQQVEQGERSKKGLGLGLALAQNFVQMHGGSIKATSGGTGQGSRFSVRLPLFFAQNPAEEQTKETKDIRPHRKNKMGLLVLIVDDNDAAAGAIGRLLEFERYKVAYAYDGNQALEKAKRLSPDAILLDVGLPDQDGYTVAKKLRERGYNGRLIALTGYSATGAREKGKEAGFEQYLVKPVGLVELHRALVDLT